MAFVLEVKGKFFWALFTVNNLPFDLGVFSPMKLSNFRLQWMAAIVGIAPFTFHLMILEYFVVSCMLCLLWFLLD